MLPGPENVNLGRILESAPNPMLPGPPPGNQLAHAKYCGFHCSGNRMKGEPQTRECNVCHTMITTNYTDCSLCPDCSSSRNQCLICGNAAQDTTPVHNQTAMFGQTNPQDATPIHNPPPAPPMFGHATPMGMGGQMDPRFFVATPNPGPRGTRAPMHQGHMGVSASGANIPAAQHKGGDAGAHPPAEQQPHQSQLPPQVPPRFCCMHDDSIKRVKAAPRDRQCAECGRAVQTNYKEFTLCAWCSDSSDRCMLCGHSASGPGTAGPQMRYPAGAEANVGGPLAARRLH